MPATIPALHKTPFVLDPRPLRGCASPHAGLLAVARTARASAAQRRALTVATLDADTTIIACQKREAQPTGEGARGYQPLVVAWAEADLVVADEFREGNGVPLSHACAARSAGRSHSVSELTVLRFGVPDFPPHHTPPASFPPAYVRFWVIHRCVCRPWSGRLPM